jgi:hypothetical protein
MFQEFEQNLFQLDAGIKKSNFTQSVDIERKIKEDGLMNKF